MRRPVNVYWTSDVRPPVPEEVGTSKVSPNLVHYGRPLLDQFWISRECRIPNDEFLQRRSEDPKNVVTFFFLDLFEDPSYASVLSAYFGHGFPYWKLIFRREGNLRNNRH